MKLRLVVPCTKRKRVSNHTSIDFHRLPTLPPVALASEWLRIGNSTTTIEAKNLYCGAGWTTSFRAFEAAQQIGDTQLSIISAGFGMVTADQLLPHYNATFASETDQIGRRVAMPGNLSERHSAWWSAINTARDLSSKPLADTLSDSTHVIVVAGSRYLFAIQNDLFLLQERLSPKRLWIISAGTPTISSLQPSLLPLSAKMEYILPGPRSALNQRIAEWLLQKIVPNVGWDRTQIEQCIHQAEYAAHKQISILKREKQTDIEVQSWLIAELATSSWKSANSLLVSYRSSGRACEEKRFRRLYNDIYSQASQQKRGSIIPWQG